MHASILSDFNSAFCVITLHVINKAHGDEYKTTAENGIIQNEKECNIVTNMENITLCMQLFHNEIFCYVKQCHCSKSRMNKSEYDCKTI